MFGITLDDKAKRELADVIAPLVVIKKADPDWMKFKDCYQDLFAGKDRAWVGTYIFDAFPEVQMENGDPNAWVKGAHGKGHVTRIYVPLARPWLRKHHNEINWLAKNPKDL